MPIHWQASLQTLHLIALKWHSLQYGNSLLRLKDMDGLKAIPKFVL